MISKKRLKRKMYQPPPTVEHKIDIIISKGGWSQWGCSCGEWSFMAWGDTKETIWWANLHKAATAEKVKA